MAGVGGVAPEALARHDGVDRQRVVAHGLLHQVDLHRRGVRAQQHRLGLPEVEVHGVVHAAGRMGRRHVERLEVVPVRLGLGALGHGEAHADEDVLELGPGLGDEVQVPAGRRRAHLVRDDLGQVEPVGPERLGPLGLGQLGAARRQQRLELRLRLVEAAAGLLAGLGIEAAQGAVGPGQRASACPGTRSRPGPGPRSTPRPRWPARRRRRCRRCRGPRCRVAMSSVMPVTGRAVRRPRCYVARHRRPGVGGTPRSRPRRRPRRR